MLDIDAVYEKTANVPMDEYIEGRILKSKVEIMLKAVNAGMLTGDLVNIIFDRPVRGAKEEETETPQKPARGGRTGSRIQIDMGKVHALMNAGWSMNKIADEMNVSAYTIRCRLDEEEDKKAEPKEASEA